MALSASILEQVNNSSAQLTAWALAIAGGTALAIVSTSYRRPTQVFWRLPYLLFIPGWAALAVSLYWGNVLVGHFLASLMVAPELLREIAEKINIAYACQREYLLYSLIFFGAWLLFYLLTWIFNDAAYKGESK